MSSSSRLLYLVGELRTGGLERQLCFLLQGMDRERYRPAVVVWRFREDDTYARAIGKLDVPTYSLSDSSSSMAKLAMLRRIVADTQPGVVHSYSFYTNVAAWLATRGTKAIAVGAVQSDFIRDKKQSGPWLGRLSARWPRTQIFNSIMAAENAQQSRTLFVARQRYVVRNGLDLQLFQSVPVSIEGHARILGIGSLFPVKRWDRLLNAALELKRKGFDYTIQIAGDGPLRSSLERHTEELGLGDHVKFIGESDNIPELLAKATFLVHTSETEGCSNALMEAMASGRAVVATDAGDAASVIEDGRTGFVVRRGDAAALVECMATLITNRELCRRMGEAGRVKAEREFGMDRLVSETLAVYRRAGWRDS